MAGRSCGWIICCARHVMRCRVMRAKSKDLVGVIKRKGRRLSRRCSHSSVVSSIAPRCSVRLCLNEPNRRLKSRCDNRKPCAKVVLLNGRRDEAVAGENLFLASEVKPHTEDDILLRPLVFSGPLNRHDRTARFQLHLIARLKFHATSHSSLPIISLRPRRVVMCKRCILCAMEQEGDKLLPTDYVVESIKADLSTAESSRRRRISRR